MMVLRLEHLARVGNTVHVDLDAATMAKSRVTACPTRLAPVRAVDRLDRQRSTGSEVLLYAPLRVQPLYRRPPGVGG
ncbi:MAG: hypothetical protein H7233_03320 [Pseudorhodobacter sp.]|nr:hypothetical protein [Frankiaceae bacterium]